MPGTRPGMTENVLCSVDFALPRGDGHGLGWKTGEQRLQRGQCRVIGYTVDARGAEMALEGGDHFHGRPVVFSVDRDAVAVFGERLLQVADVVADGAELERFAAHDRRRLPPVAAARIGQ